MENVPWHEEVISFVKQLGDLLPDYEIASEHEHSNCVLLAHRKVMHNSQAVLCCAWKSLSEGSPIPYILESNPHPFCSFRGLKIQTRVTIACGLDLRSRAGFWKNVGAAVRAVRTVQYSNLLFYLLLIIYYSSDSPSSLITESLFVLRRDCTCLLRKTHFTVLVWLIGPRRSVGF